MKNYSVAILTKIGPPTERGTDTITMVKVSVSDEKEILKEAFKSKYIFDLISQGHRYCSYVYDEI